MSRTGARSSRVPGAQHGRSFEQTIERTDMNDATNPTACPNLHRLHAALEQLDHLHRPRYRRLWAYYANPMRLSCALGESTSQRPYRQAQEWGLPARITGCIAGSEPFSEHERTSTARKEVVIENDICWRVDTMVDYLFGRPLVISSSAPDPRRRAVIGKLLRLVVAQNGGIRFLQQMALIGAVYGFVDVVVKLAGTDGARPCCAAQSSCSTASLGEAPKANERSSRDAEQSSGTQDGGQAPAPDSKPQMEGGAASMNDDPRIAGDLEDPQDALLQRVARMIRLEIVEPARALPLLSSVDWRVVEAYGQAWEIEEGSGFGGQGSVKSGWWGRLRSYLNGENRRSSTQRIVEIITPDRWMRFQDDKPVASGANSLGEIPLVHIQNSAAALAYSGASDVEPLIPLQDELNTRLSDRAQRITLQSFKMYLGKGIEAFVEQPIGPGRMWMTDNEKASIEEFGGDAGCPSEEAHIADIREALDKSSGVTPIAAGAIKNRIGRLTSAAALRVTLLALLSKTDKKRALYGAGIERMCELALKWLDVAGIFATAPQERGVELSWPSPLPENDLEKLEEAEAKLRIGVDRQVVLRELGY